MSKKSRQAHPTQAEILEMARFLASYKVPTLRDGSYRVRVDGKEIVVYPPKNESL